MSQTLNLDVIMKLRECGLLDRIFGIAERVCRETGVSIQEICSRRKTPRIVEARTHLMRELRKLRYKGVELSFPIVGGLVNHDHTCVILALERDAELRAEFERREKVLAYTPHAEALDTA